MQNFVEENKLQHGERESPKLRGGKLRFNFIALSLVYFVWNQLTYTTIPKQIVKWNWTTGKIEPQQNVFPQHTCQLSRFSRESPSFSSNIPVSRLEHQISRIKWTFEHFCALVWNLVHFFTKFKLFVFIVQFLGHFCACLVNDKDWFVIAMVWFHVLHVLRQFVGVGRGCWCCRHSGVGGGGVVQNRESPDFRSPEVGRYASGSYRQRTKCCGWFTAWWFQEQR